MTYIILLKMIIKRLVLLLLVILNISLKGQDFWEEVNIPDSITPASVCFNNESDIYLSSSLGLYKSTDGGNTWTKLLNYLAGLSTIVKEPDEIFVGLDSFGNLFHSINDGMSWDTISSNIGGVYLKMIGDTLLFCLDWGIIYKSIDYGNTWIQVDSTASSELFCDIIENVNILFSGSIAFLDPQGGGVCRSLDSGNSWQQISLPGYGVSSFALDKDSNLLCGVRFHYYSQEYGVFRSYDFGLSWNNILWGYIVTSLAVDVNGGIYAGCDSDFGPEGVMFSPDNGISWEPINSGLHEDASITSLAISPNGYVYTTTDAPSKLYKSINSIVKIDVLRSPDSILQIFPNPCRNILNFKIGLNSAHSYVLIEFINLSGKVILVKNIDYSGGRYISCNISSLKQGLYIVKLQSNLRAYTGRFIKY